MSIKEPIQAFYNNKIYVHRLTTPAHMHEFTLPEGAYALIKSPDNLIDNLTLSPQTEHKLAAHEVEISVCASGLNFRDVLNALGLYPGEPGPLGGEVAGIVRRVGKAVKSFKPGDAVFGLSASGFRSHAITYETLIIKLPKTLSFAQAAGLPIGYLTAFEGLIQLAKLKKGDKVLIHAATGSVGLSAVQLAKQVGAEIYATASSSKQTYLKELGIKHIYDSRSTDFGAQILKDTKNKGVDVVLNSLTSEGFIDASLSCLKKNGIFIEIGKRNIYSQEQMQSARADVEYHIVAIDDLMQQQPDYIGEMLQTITDLLTQEAIQPITSDYLSH